MLKKDSDFIVASEITCIAKDVETPELSASGNFSKAEEAKRLKDILHDYEQDNSR